jgi:gamma-carbonic anhydrase
MKKPIVDESAYIAPSADLLGEVKIGKKASVWHHATLRGDVDRIEVGNYSNIQDNCVLHVSTGTPCIVGAYVTVGHSAILHSCTIGDHTLVGMGAIVLDGAKVGKHVLIGAGSMITKNKEIPDGSLVMGRPAKVVRMLTLEEIAYMEESALHYMDAAEAFMSGEIKDYHDR